MRTGSLIGCLLIGMLDSITVDAAESQVADAITALREWRARLQSFSLRWTTSNDPYDFDALYHQRLGKRASSRSEWYWHQDQRFRHSVVTEAEGLPGYRRLSGGDAYGWFSAMYPPNAVDFEHPTQVIIELTEQVRPYPVGSPLQGLYHEPTRQWLDERLATIEVLLISADDDTLRIAFPPEKQLREVLELDVRHHYLPRKVEAKHDIFEDEAWHNRVVEVFSEQQPGWFFPWSGSSDSPYGCGRWSIVDLQLNPEIDPQQLLPPLPVGTQVTDRLRNQQYVVGQPQPAAAPPPPPTTAWTLPRWLRLPALLAVCVLLGVLIARKMSRSSSRQQSGT